TVLRLKVVKRLLVGGDDSILTEREWDYVKSLLDVLLDPVLLVLFPETGESEVLQSPALASMIDAIVLHLDTRPDQRPVLIADVAEALRAFGLMDALPPAWTALKVLVFGGSATVFAREEWAALLRDVRTLIPTVLWARDLDWSKLSANELEVKLRALSAQLLPVIAQIPARHAGRIPIGLLDAIFELIPDSAFRDNHLTRPLAIELFRKLKTLLAGGSSNSITSAEWTPLMDGLFEAGVLSAWLARTSKDPLEPTPGAKLNLPQLTDVWRHFMAIRPIIGRALAIHGGSLSVDEIAKLVLRLPDAWLPIDRPVLLQTLKPILNRVLRTGVPDALDLKSMDRLITLADRWLDLQLRLEDIFEIFSLDPLQVETARYVSAAESYLEGLPSADREEAQKVLAIGRNYRALFPGKESRIRFDPWVQNGLPNLSLMLTLEMIAEELLNGYSSVPGAKKGTVEDLRAVLDDGDELAFALKVVLPDAQRLADKRFREGDLLIFGSDGDGFLSIQEIAVYLAFAISATNIYMDVLHAIEPVCLDVKEGRDELEHWWMGARCFRSNFYPKFEWFWQSMPGMVDFWASLPSRAREQVIVSIEQGTRLNKYNHGPMATYDTQAVTGIFQYVEALFIRMD
ncbi:MAG: hypothetical protein AAB425_04105, partial [Bdellovibrionota bacterium]